MSASQQSTNNRRSGQKQRKRQLAGALQLRQILPVSKLLKLALILLATGLVTNFGIVTSLAEGLLHSGDYSLTNQTAPKTYYLDAQVGNDSNPGTQSQPWKTVTKAIASIAPGDTLMFNSGIYTLNSAQTYYFGPSGTDVSHKTTYKAVSGARAIITGADQKPLNIHLMAYMHVEGLWFGGIWDTVNGIDAYGHGAGANPLFVLGGPLNDVINCTFFGYGNLSNGADYLFFQGNRSVRTGAGDLSHGIYLTGRDGTTNQQDNHAIVDNNIFVGQEIPNPNYGKVAGVPQTYLMGLGIQVWHIHNNDIITRNFVTHHIADTVGANADSDTSVRSELVANNVWWENGLATDIGYPHGFDIHGHTIYLNNVGGPGGGVASSDIQTTAVGNTFGSNAFMLGIANHLLPNAPVVSATGPLTLSQTDIALSMGTTPTKIDQSIAALQSAFSIGVNGRTIQNLWQDQSVEGNFANLKFATQSSGAFFGSGTAWFNPTNPTQPPAAGSTTNVGPDAPVPSSPGNFWAAFRALGMQDYDDSGNRMKAPYPTYPYSPQSTTADTIGVFRPSTKAFYLRNANSAGNASITVTFNPASRGYPIVGDWTGALIDTVGVYDQSNGQFILCTANGTATCANAGNQIRFTLGNPNDVPISGRWTLSISHKSGAGIFRPTNGLIYLRNTLTTGYADNTMVLGIPGDKGLAGDWNGKGFESPGVFRPAQVTFYLSNKVLNGSVYGDYSVTFGTSGDLPVIGDWIAQGHNGLGLFRGSSGSVLLKNQLVAGYADASFAFGTASDIPVAGNWGTGSPAPALGPDILVTPPTNISSAPPKPTQVQPGVSGDSVIGD